MAKTYHCWRCKIPVPMLNEDEWEEIYPLLKLDTDAIKDLRREKQLTLREAITERSFSACEKFYELTGFRESNHNAIWHHRLSLYGDECPSCGHLIRTPTARFCAQCGYRPSDNKVTPKPAT